MNKTRGILVLAIGGSLLAFAGLLRADCDGCNPDIPELGYALRYQHPIGTIVIEPTDTLLRIQQNYEIFRLLAGGCLRGPLYFLDDKGSKTFVLEAGVDYPTGCSKQEKK